MIVRASLYRTEDRLREAREAFAQAWDNDEIDWVAEHDLAKLSRRGFDVTFREDLLCGGVVRVKRLGTARRQGRSVR